MPTNRTQLKSGGWGGGGLEERDGILYRHENSCNVQPGLMSKGSK